MIVHVGYKWSESKVQWPHFLLNKWILTWEESDKRILHSTLQADLRVTKDTNEKGDMSSLWCSQAGELFGGKPCRKIDRQTDREKPGNESNVLTHPTAYRAVKEKPLQPSPGHKTHGPVTISLPFSLSFLWSHWLWWGKEREREKELEICQRWQELQWKLRLLIGFPFILLVSG